MVHPRTCEEHRSGIVVDAGDTEHSRCVLKGKELGRGKRRGEGETVGGGGDGGDGDRDGRRVKRPRAIFRFSRVRCAGKGEMVARRSVEESSIGVIEGTGVDQYRKIKHIQTSQRSHRVRVGMNCRDYYGPWRCTLERAQQDLVIVHTCRGWVTKKAKLLELLKAAGNGVVRRGGRKPVPCAGVEAEKELADHVVPADGVPKVAAAVVASCGAGSVDGMVSKPLPSGW